MRGKARMLIFTVGPLAAMSFCTEARAQAGPQQLEITAQRFSFTPSPPVQITRELQFPLVDFFGGRSVGYILSCKP